MCEVGACPDCHVNELAVGPQNALFDFCINDGWISASTTGKHINEALYIRD